jgi:hypothetical protein
MSSADRAARERKQKIFVAVGGLVLLGLLAIEVPHFLGGSSGTSATPSTATTTTTPGDVPGGAETTPAVTATAAPVALVDTDRPLAPAPGQLSSFTKFAGKDPFVQQVSFSDSASPGSNGSAGTSEAKKNDANANSKGFTVGGSPTASVTVISVNGARQALVPGAAFPSADPVFVLVSEQLRTKSVIVGIAGGAYASGSKTTKLVIGKPLVLVNTTTGARYKLVLVAVGNGQATPKADAKSPSSGAGTSAPATPTP